ncbi:MAG: hypothetical protein C0453_05345 [Comamonadaceae bacterium]|nr:hypothetical protein [Comamonadaceae bacterium]
MSALEESEPLNHRSAPTPAGTRLERIAWWVLALYGLALVLRIVPWYHPGYRFPVHLANTLLLIASALSIVLLLIPACIRSQQWRRLLAVLSAGLVLFIVTGQAHAWRLALTDGILQAHHCQDNTQTGGARVLGGLVRAGGLGAGDGTEFINSTHCLLVVCQEERFRCPQPSLTDDIRRP